MALTVLNQNGTLPADHFVDLKAIPRVLYSTNQFSQNIYRPRFNSILPGVLA